MKLSKKLLGVVLSGFMVVGASQVTLVKANAQVQWKQPVRIGLQAKGVEIIKDAWQIDLVLEGGYLKLEGPTNIPSRWTFDDEFHFGKVGDKARSSNKPLVVRTNNVCAPGPALKRLMDQFNDLELTVGDEIYMHGQNSQTTLKFPGSSLTIRRQPMARGPINNYDYGYQHVNRHQTGFIITGSGLYEKIYNYDL